MNPVGLFLLLGGLALFGAAWWAYAKRRHMMDTPTSKVRSMAIGPVELNGVAVLPPGRQYQRGPFTDEPCLYWEYKVEEQRTRRTKNGTQTYWATIASDRSKAPIALRDDTGVVVVDPQGSELPAPVHTRYGSGFGRDPPQTVLAFLRTKGISHETLFGINKKMRYSEDRLMEGTKLYVLGNATRRDDLDAPAGASGSSLPSVAAVATGVGNEALVVQREGDGTFLVSAKSEKQLVRQWTALFWVMLVAGILMAAGGAYVSIGG